MGTIYKIVADSVTKIVHIFEIVAKAATIFDTPILEVAHIGTKNSCESCHYSYIRSGAYWHYLQNSCESCHYFVRN